VLPAAYVPRGIKSKEEENYGFTDLSLSYLTMNYGSNSKKQQQALHNRNSNYFHTEPTIATKPTQLNPLSVYASNTGDMDVRCVMRCPSTSGCIASDIVGFIVHHNYIQYALFLSLTVVLIGLISLPMRVLCRCPFKQVTYALRVESLLSTELIRPNDIRVSKDLTFCC